MNTNTLNPAGNLISHDWRLDALRSVRDRLQSLDADALLDCRDELAVKLSEAIGGLTHQAPAPARTLLDGGPDFEITVDDLDPVAWPVYVDPTPLDVLALDLPSLSGGSPEAFSPSVDDWSDYAAYCELQDSLDMQEDAHRCGMAV